VFELDAHEFQPSSEPILISEEADDRPDRLTSRARLQTIASILAMAVIRRKTRMASGYDIHDHEGSLPACGEGLDLSGEQSVHA
jgi:hypothetical protein